MPLVQNTASIAAGATLENVMDGSQFEFLPWNALLEFGLQASAAGLVCDVYSGQDVLAENMALPLQNRYPIYPDDFTLNDVAAGGERVKVRVRNPTAGPLVVFWGIRITPAG